MKSEKNILLAFILNFSFAIIEFIGGVFTQSIAITTDAIHDVGDALSIGLSYILERISKRGNNDKYTYGYLRYSCLGSIITTSILFIGSLVVIYNAVIRIINPVPINYDGMIILGIFGVVINFLALYFTKDASSLNEKAINLHMLEDVLGWVVVLIGAIIMRFTDISIIDPILSILVAIFILKNVIINLKNILDIFLEKTPTGISLNDIRQTILNIKGVEDVHHMHIWSIDGINHSATMHVVISGKEKKQKEKIKKELKDHGILHTTIEIESQDEPCYDSDCHLENSDHDHHHHF